MASYDVVVKVVDQTRTPLRNIENGLKNVEDRTRNLNTALGNLGRAIQTFATIATAAFGVATRDALNFANQVDDVANATNLSRESIVNFGNAVQAAGGKSSTAIEALNRFNENIAEAANGSRSLRDAFDKVGVSLDDLARLSEQDLLDTVVKGLGDVANQSERAALQSTLFGRAFRGVNAAQVADEFANAGSEGRRLADNIKLAADATDVLERAYNRFRARLLDTLAPINKFITELDPGTLDRIINTVTSLAAAIVGLTLALKGVELVGKVFVGLTTTLAGLWATFKIGSAIIAASAGKLSYLAGAMAVLFTSSRSLTDKFKILWTAIRGGSAGASVGLLAVAGRALAGLAIGAGKVTFALGSIAAIAAAVGLVIDAVFGTKIIDFFIDKVARAYRGLKEFLGLSSEATGPRVSAPEPPGFQEALERSRQLQAAASAGITEGPTREVTNAFTRLKDSLKQTTEDYNALTKAIAAGVDDVNLLSLAFEAQSAAAETLGRVLQKPTELITRDFSLGLAKSAEALRQQEIVLRNTTLIQDEYANTLRQSQLELDKQRLIFGNSANVIAEYRIELGRAALENSKQLAILQDTGVQTEYYANELMRLSIELVKNGNDLKFRRDLLDNTAVQERIYANELQETTNRLVDQSSRLRNANLQQQLYNITLAEGNLALVDQEQRLNNVALQTGLYNQEIRRGNLELQDQQQRLANTALQQALFAQEIQRTYFELEQQQQRLNDTVNFERLLQNELRRSWLELEEKRKRLENTGYQEELFNQQVLRNRQALQEQTIALGLANEKFQEGRITLEEYADMLGQVNERLLTSDQLLARYRSQGRDEVRLTNNKKAALDKLIDNYKTAGGVSTEEFRKTAEALGANKDQIDIVVAQYGSFADLVRERNEMIKDSIFDVSKIFVKEFTQAFIQGKNVLDSFKNFFVNILNTIAAEIVKQQIALPIAGYLSTGLGSLLGGLFGTSVDVSSIPYQPALAQGGITGPDRPYIVGEQGPELFVPNRTGRVLPNDVLGSTMGAQDGGGGALTVNFTINAVDTQTGVQFLLQNKPVITSMISDAYNRRGRRGPLD